jgi:hypothetical protein
MTPTTVWIGGVDRTALVQKKSLRVTLRADKRNECKLTIQSTANSWLPTVGQDLQVKV